MQHRNNSLNPLYEIEDQSLGRGFMLYVLHKKWYPNPNIYSTMGILGLLAVMFLVLSFMMLGAHKNVVEVRVEQYQELPQCKEVLHQKGKYCDIPVTIHRLMEEPIHVLFQLDNFYQNHRRYVQSKNIDQLAGKIISYDQAKSSCHPIVLNKDLHTKYAWDGKTLLNPNAVASPCGLIAHTLFNDTYQFFTQNGTRIPINESSISLLNDHPGKYKRSPDSSRIQWLDPTDQHFIVWMRTAGLSSSRKLFGRINKDLQPGRYYVRIVNNYDARMINADKTFVLTTANIFGGTNLFMTIAFGVAGVFCIGAVLVFFIRLYMTNWTFGVEGPA